MHRFNIVDQELFGRVLGTLANPQELINDANESLCKWWAGHTSGQEEWQIGHADPEERDVEDEGGDTAVRNPRRRILSIKPSIILSKSQHGHHGGGFRMKWRILNYYVKNGDGLDDQENADAGQARENQQTSSETIDQEGSQPAHHHIDGTYQIRLELGFELDGIHQIRTYAEERELGLLFAQPGRLENAGRVKDDLLQDNRLVMR